MFQKIKIISFILAVCLFLFLAQNISAESPLNSGLLNGVANQAGYNTQVNAENVFVETLGSIVFMIVSFIGILFILLILYGGYVWMNARGNESEVEKAKHTIRDAIIGMLVLAASYSIWLIIQRLIMGEPIIGGV